MFVAAACWTDSRFPWKSGVRHSTSGEFGSDCKTGRKHTTKESSERCAVDTRLLDPPDCASSNLEEFDRLRDVIGSSIRQVIAIHTRQHDVVQTPSARKSCSATSAFLLRQPHSRHISPRVHRIFRLLD